MNVWGICVFIIPSIFFMFFPVFYLLFIGIRKLIGIIQCCIKKIKANNAYKVKRTNTVNAYKVKRTNTVIKKKSAFIDI